MCQTCFEGLVKSIIALNKGEARQRRGIAQSFPVLSLEQVYGAIAFYLANRSEIDAYLAKAEVSFESLRQAATILKRD